MNTQEIKELALAASEKYYEYLRLYSKGLEKIAVNKVEFIDNFVCLHLNSAVIFSEKVEIEICGISYDSHDIKIIEFDQEENTVLILPKINLKPLFYQVEANDIKVVADLKVLVDRVRQWYESLSGTLQLPAEVPVRDFDLTYGLNLSEKQKAMVSGVFDNPFTFIWGEQGTAKTFAVLADCVMNYVRNKQKIIITAPTNNALDRTLSYVLEVLKRENIPLKKVLRLGLATKKFAKRYNEACELSGIEKMVSGMESRIKDLEEAYEFFVYCEQYDKMKEDIPETFNKLEEVYKYKKEVFQTLESVNAEWDDLNNKRQALKEDVKNLNRRFIETNDEILRYNAKKVKFFHKNRLEEAEHLKIQLRKALDIKNDRIDELDYDINLLTIRKDQLTKAYVGDNRDRMYIETIKRLTEFDIEIFNLVKDINEETYAECKQTLIKIVANYDTVMRQRSRKYYMYKGMKLEDILAKINSMNSEKNNLIKMSTIERAKEVLIVAAPIDTYLSRIAVDGDLIGSGVKHIFMDEAGNCPVVKGLSLLKKNVPVTLVGDISQRELTCEMTYNEIVEPENQPVVMWAQSVLHIEELVQGGFEEFLAAYMKEKKAPYENLVMLS